jgi:hypothetical protein
MATKSVTDYLKRIDRGLEGTCLWNGGPTSPDFHGKMFKIKESHGALKSFYIGSTLRFYETGSEAQPPRILDQVFLSIIYDMAMDYTRRIRTLRTPWIPLLGSTDIHYRRAERTHDKLMTRIMDCCHSGINLKATSDAVSKAKADVQTMLESGILSMRFNPNGNYANLCRAIVARMGATDGWSFSDEFKRELGIDTHLTLASRASM